MDGASNAGNDLAREGCGRDHVEMTLNLTIGTLLALIALICGALMLASGRWSRLPLAAIAIICLALDQSGLLAGLTR
jgi:hypothetical protein